MLCSGRAYKLGSIDPVPEDCVDPRWKWFKGCLGALDGTYIDVTVPKSDKSRYRTRKSRISTNVLGVCNRNMNFVYVLSSWEGSVSDSRVLRDAITRCNGLKIPIGCYYLVDVGYTNRRGFLSPYRNVRYHVNEKDGQFYEVPRSILLGFYPSFYPRQWTEQETEQFVVFMEELVVEGKRADADQFKPGVFQKLADKMNEKFLGCVVLGGILKRYVLNWIVNKYWKLGERCDRHNVTLYTPGKPFPLFERLESIFGKDRATGLDACSEKDAEEDVTPGSTFAAATAGGLGLGGDDVDMEDLAAAESELPNTFSTSFASSSEKNQGRHSATKKSNDAAVLSNLAETFKAAVEDQGKHVQVLANAMSGVNEQVNLGRTLKILGFNTMKIVQIAKKFVQNPKLKATFWSLDEEKAAFARDIMENF
ncbi:uncharacterized protein DS421_11g325340 [Arachis hypogaea]|nr:uncharacterized protein DS421_11g325340 [Arachis hypogaea]